MTDDLDALKAAMNAATPDPNPLQKRENIVLAEKNFAALQGSHPPARPIVQTGLLGRFLNKGKSMLKPLSTRTALTASTALVAVGLIAILPNSGEFADDFTPTPDVFDTTLEEADVAAEAVIAEPLLQPETSARQRSDGTLFFAPDTADMAPNSVTVHQSPRQKSSAGIGNVFEQPIVIDDAITRPTADTDTFANAPQNPLKITAEDPVSTFSIDVDTASYSTMRRWLMNGQLPPKDAIRVEEIVNYFPYAYPEPTGVHPFQPTASVTPTPWNKNTNLVHIAIQGTEPLIQDRPPLNLVFLIDTSGSMQSADKLPLLKQSFRLMLSELRPEDEIAIVTYAGRAGQVLAPTPARDRTTILNALENLEAGGGTAGQAGLEQAYQTGQTMHETGDVTRVILATDGDFNLGLSDPDALKTFIADKRKTGTYLSVLGFGRGNLDDATMQALAQNGNGQAAYIDTLAEAQKILADQLTGALFPIATDVKIQVEFNPNQIGEYRLIGYETRALNRQDFNNEKVDAGDIGAGHRVTAIFEVTPVGSDAIQNGPLRYADTDDTPATSTELGFLKLRYKRPGESESTLIETPIQPGATALSTDATFSIAMAGFGELLRDSAFTGTWTWQDAIELATQSKGSDPFGYRAEAITLMRLAESLTQ